MKNFDPDQVRLEFKLYHIIAIFFIFCFIISNVTAIKISKIGIFILPAGTVIFPLSYVFSDILTEVYGFQRSRQLVWIAIFCNFLFVLFSYIAIKLPVAPDWSLRQKEFNDVFSIEPRIFLASSVAYFVGDYINCTILAKLKLISQNQWIWFRFVGSTALGVAFDNTLFSIFAFLGKMPLHTLIWLAFGQYILKISYEGMMSPISVKISQWLKHFEKTDIYDFDTHFSPIHLAITYTDANNFYS